MSAIIKENPTIRFEGSPRDPDQMIGDDELATAFFEFKFFMPDIVLAAEEMTNEELLVAAADIGTFRFLDSPEEDKYSPEG